MASTSRECYHTYPSPRSCSTPSRMTIASPSALFSTAPPNSPLQLVVTLVIFLLYGSFSLSNTFVGNLPVVDELRALLQHAGPLFPSSHERHVRNSDSHPHTSAPERTGRSSFNANRSMRAKHMRIASQTEDSVLDKVASMWLTSSPS
jgi:hypothetical protein